MAHTLLTSVAVAGLAGLAGCINTGNVNVFGNGNEQYAGLWAPSRENVQHASSGSPRIFSRASCENFTEGVRAPSYLASCSASTAFEDYFSAPYLFTCTAFRGDANGNGVLDAGDVKGYRRVFGLDDPLVLVAWAPTTKPVQLQIYDSHGCLRFKESYVNQGTGVQLPFRCARDLGVGRYHARMLLDQCGEGQWKTEGNWTFEVCP